MYARICAEFEFSQEEDLASAKKLAGLLGDRGNAALERTRNDFPEFVLICGGAENLSDELSSMSVNSYVVAADGATTVLAEAGIDADMIVTDLDGIVEDQIAMNSRGATVFVHAHGDNQRAIASYATRFVDPVVGTCQCAPPAGIFNFGGFTDGDRAACICAELGARKIMLAGFDFELPARKTGKSIDVKRRKLRWAELILDELRKSGIEIVRAVDQAGLP